MANDWDINARNVGLDAIASACRRLALHTGDPGGPDSAGNEVIGGSPPYDRRPVEWNAASGGVTRPSAHVVFDVPTGATVSWVSGWDEAGSRRYFKRQVDAEVFGAQGTYTVLAETTSIDLNGC